MRANYKAGHLQVCLANHHSPVPHAGQVGPASLGNPMGLACQGGLSSLEDLAHHQLPAHQASRKKVLEALGDLWVLVALVCHLLHHGLEVHFDLEILRVLWCQVVPWDLLLLALHPSLGHPAARTMLGQCSSQPSHSPHGSVHTQPHQQDTRTFLPGNPGCPLGPMRPNCPGFPGAPAGPGRPGGPDGPSSPLLPCVPCGPCGPGWPGGDGSPERPGSPRAPLSPLMPCGPGGPMGPSGPCHGKRYHMKQLPTWLFASSKHSRQGCCSSPEEAQ
ncbi:Accumulation-associated protein [Portunus trituberculatus]|uniref:Accumulation-associated protein n=1 Tax=Portunus trituberculatus TaxID=210409 RepID=A0A5B7DGS1_PORTR|nr:Accumulation-associated protein [Portunus trituberculatus]